MQRPRNGMKPADQAGRRRVQQLVADAEQPRLAYCRLLRPTTLLDDLLQRNTIASTAPCGENHVRLDCRDFFGSDRLPRRPDKLSSRSFDQFGDPRLRDDNRLAPLLQNTLSLDAVAVLSRTAVIEFC